MKEKHHCLSGLPTKYENTNVCAYAESQTFMDILTSFLMLQTTYKYLTREAATILIASVCRVDKGNMHLLDY